MDPISVGLLAALAGGVGGEVGKQSWAALTALVRRPFHRHDHADAPALPSVGSGEAELVALERAPADPVRAQALITALAMRTAVDPGFGTDLQKWHKEAKLVRTGDGDTSNTISGGTQHSIVLQGRDFSNNSLSMPIASPPSTATGSDGLPTPTS